MNEQEPLAQWLPTTETQEEASRADAALIFAQNLEVVDDQSYTLSGVALTQCKGLADKLEAMRTGFVKPLNDHVKYINAFFRPRMTNIGEAEKVLKDKRFAFRQQERAKQVELEAQRAKEQHEREEAAAKKAAKAKTKVEAEAIKTQAVLEAPPPVQSTIPKNDGLSIRKSYKAVCDDIVALCEAIAAASTRDEKGRLASYILPNNSQLNALARAERESFNLPGCRLIVEEIEARGRKQ